MIGLLLRAAALAAIYLLFLTSIAIGDVVIGALLGLALAYALHPGAMGPVPAAGWPTRIGAALVVFARTLAQMVRGSWRVIRFCVGAPSSPGFVEVPRGERSRVNVALWGLLTGESPDEIVVDFERSRDVLIVHLIDASDPDQVIDRHRQAYERWQRKVVQ